MPDTKQVNVRLPLEYVARLEQLAQADYEASVSSIVRLAVRQFLVRRRLIDGEES